jgi:hypothetical protein
MGIILVTGLLLAIPAFWAYLRPAVISLANNNQNQRTLSERQGVLFIKT